MERGGAWGDSTEYQFLDSTNELSEGAAGSFRHWENPGVSPFRNHQESRRKHVSFLVFSSDMGSLSTCVLFGGNYSIRCQRLRRLVGGPYHFCYNNRALPCLFLCITLCKQWQSCHWASLAITILLLCPGIITILSLSQDDNHNLVIVPGIIYNPVIELGWESQSCYCALESSTILSLSLGTIYRAHLLPPDQGSRFLCAWSGSGGSASHTAANWGVQ